MVDKNEAFDCNMLPEILPVYYNRLFPFDSFYRWLSYGNCKLERLFFFKSRLRLGFGVNCLFYCS